MAEERARQQTSPRRQSSGGSGIERSRSSDIRRQPSAAVGSNADYHQFPNEATERRPSPSPRQMQPFDIEQQHSADSNGTHNSKNTSSSFIGNLMRKGSNVNTTQQLPHQPQHSTVSQSFSTTRGYRSRYKIAPRLYKGFSTPFCGLFATSGGLPTADHVHNNDNDNASQSQSKNNNTQSDAREIHYSHLRTDLCSLPCFGILQSDYTRYLFTHTRPPTFCKRSTTHVLIPLTLFLIAGFSSGNIKNEYVNNIVCTLLVYFIAVWIVGGCLRGRKKRVMVREEILWRLKRREEKITKRMEERKNATAGGATDTDGTHSGGGLASVVNKAKTEDEEYEYYSEDEFEYHKSGYEFTLGQSRFEMNCAHRLLGCYPSDIPRNAAEAKVAASQQVSDNYVLQQQDKTDIAAPSSVDTAGCDGCGMIDTNNGDDLCSEIWSYVSKPCFPCIPCCNNSYGCHLELCGMCGIAQEAREANLTLPRHLRMIDYITMEPFLLYYPKIVELRKLVSSSFFEHVRALSQLSKLLLVSFKVILIALFCISLVDGIRYWQPANMAVLITTFLQSFAVIYAVHWGWHRYDLSIDAVIKYYACGFVLCTGMAYTVEFAEYIIFKLMVMFVIWILEVQEVQENGYGDLSLRGGMHTMTDSGTGTRFLKYFGIDNNDHFEQHLHGRSLTMGDNVLQGFFERNPEAKVIYIFIASYIMAGLVEEVCKYFGFVLVDHPDFCSERELAKAKASMPMQLLRDRADDEDDDEETVNSGGGANNDQTNNRQQQASAAPNANAVVNDKDAAAIAAFNPSNQRRSLVSIRAGVTVAMVAVAIGFTCCENVVHIFFYNSRSSVKTQIATLVIKSLFPVHAIAAAIQSVYVCRRDLEKDRKIGLGRIIFPSMIFHGSYDFVLLMLTDSWQRSHKEQYFNNGGGDITYEALIIFLVSLFIVLLGGVYYFYISQAQYVRLRSGTVAGRGGRNDDALATGLLI